MSFDNLSDLLKILASISFGVFFGILRSKIFADKIRTGLHIVFIVFALAVVSITVIGFIAFCKEIFKPFNTFNFLIFSLTLVGGAALFYFTRRYLIVKDVFKSNELDPIVNNFTSDADKGEIKLFGGDLNFLGNSTTEMDLHPQYINLKSGDFKKILILCERPNGNSQKIRYGKILNDFPQAEFGFYNPETADLKVRGRIIKVNGVDKLLMYTKIRAKTYRTIETDTANSNGALYNNIWQLVWSLSDRPAKAETDSYILLFKQ